MPEQTTTIAGTEEITEAISESAAETINDEPAVSFPAPEAGQSTIIVTDSYNTYIVPVEAISEAQTEAPVTEETSVTLTEATIATTASSVSIQETVQASVVSGQEQDISETILTEAILETSVSEPQTEATTVYTQPQTPTVSMNISSIVPLAAIVLLAGAYFAVTKFSKKKPKNGAKTAKDLDEERLAAENSKKQKKEKEVKDKKNFSKDALQTIPYQKVLENDIFFLGNKMYSKAYTFDDVNFNLGDEDEQYLYLERYIKFLNILDDTIDCQICLWNARIDIEDFKKKILMVQKGDKYFDHRIEYNTKVLEANIKKGQNAIQKRMYVTLTIKAPDEEVAQRRFLSLDLATANSFNEIGDTNLRPMLAQERIEMLKDFFIGEDGTVLPPFTREMYDKGEEKLYFCPDYFEFKKDYFLYNNTYAKTVYIREIPAQASSDIFTSLLKTGLDIMITTNIETFDSGAAKKLVQKQITAVDTDMASREKTAAQHGNFSVQMPQSMRNERDSMVSVYNKLTNEDMKLFYINIQILIKASSFDELKNNTEIIESTLKRLSCTMGEMPWEQEDGLCDILPLGYQKNFPYQRAVPSDGVAIFMPFNVKEMQMEGSIYYGLNCLSHNMIIFNRITGLTNPAGFILGAPGGGKSMTAKREMTEVFLRYENADILIIDPEREYWKLTEAFDGSVIRFSTGSTNYINIFDFDFRLLEEPENDNDEKIDIIADKCQLVTSFISCCMDKNNPLTAPERAFIDRNVRAAYSKTGVLHSRKKEDMPTLATLLECMKEDTENVAQAIRDKLILSLDMYVNGSAKYFNNQTNVDTENRIISYDIRDLNGNLKTQSMLLILDYIWNRLSRNRDKGRTTFIYFDEAHLLFADEYCLDFLRMLWKRARKYGGVLTGITQNIEDVLRDDKSRTMLSNSEFLVLLKQNPEDAAKLRDIFHFTDNEMKFFYDTPPGHGVLVFGGGGKTKIPFYDEFPKDTKLYSMMTTNFSETAKMLSENKDKTAQTA